MGVRERLARLRIAGQQLGRQGCGLEGAAGVAGSRQRLRQGQLGLTVARVELHGPTGGLDAHCGLRGAEALAGLRQGPGRLARVVVREAPELGRRVAVRPLA